MRYAIVESGGKQYRVVEGRTIEVDRLPIEIGEKIDIERVLFMADGDEIMVGHQGRRRADGSDLLRLH